MRHLSLWLFAAGAMMAGCGTGVFTHHLEIAIADPNGRLGPPPHDVAIFDSLMGRSEEWARRTAGTTSPGTPFETSYDTVESRMMFDSSPSPRVAAALWLPAYEKAGYFQLVIEPKAGAETTITLPFAPWADFYPDGAKVVPLTARVRSEAGDRAWTLRVTIAIP
ncbi:MAG TPA: hypothetical protein VL263_24190 [Vicinamibacterales bacterium]|nr:hypothetical protein [Vicinamibacterales bacterium]